MSHIIACSDLPPPRRCIPRDDGDLAHVANHGLFYELHAYLTYLLESAISMSYFLGLIYHFDCNYPFLYVYVTRHHKFYLE
jgi:hypothetical protein